MGQDKKNISLVTIILVVLNLGLLFTIWYSRLATSTTDPLKTGTEKPALKSEEVSIERYLREELHFSNRQVLKFNEMQARHLPRANALRARTYRLRKVIMELLFNDNPNKSRIEELSYQLGLTHEKLEKEIFFHFMDLMAQCRPEQRENLKTLLRKVFEKYRPDAAPGADQDTYTEENLPPDLRTAPRPVGQPGEPRKGESERRPQKRNNNARNFGTAPGDTGNPSKDESTQGRHENFREPPPSVDGRSEPGKGDRPDSNRTPGTDRVKKDLETLTKRLNLTARQVKQVEEILTRFHSREKDFQGDPKQLKDNADRQIEALLTPRQARAFKQFKEETRDGPRQRQ
ncbi:MAG: periplasmic heavy metal sensor [bacterium]|nr:periplasmic heavy metal sensor [bacterium]